MTSTPWHGQNGPYTSREGVRDWTLHNDVHTLHHASRILDVSNSTCMSDSDSPDRLGECWALWGRSSKPLSWTLSAVAVVYHRKTHPGARKSSGDQNPNIIWREGRDRYVVMQQHGQNTLKASAGELDSTRQHTTKQHTHQRSKSNSCIYRCKE